MKKSTMLLLCLGIIAVLCRNVLVYTIGAITPGYTAANGFISELSAEGTPYETLLNWGSLIFFGFLLMLAALALRRRLGGPGLSLSMSYLAISGLGFIGVGLFPCPPGCSIEVDSLQMTLHTLCGFVGAGSLSLSAFVYGLKYFKGFKSSVRAGALALGSTGLLSFIVLWTTIVSHEFGIEIALFKVKGLLQRLNVASGDLWVVMACISCLKFNTSDKGLPPTPVKSRSVIHTGS